jgi:hypothetical protein
VQARAAPVPSHHPRRIGAGNRDAGGGEGRGGGDDAQRGERGERRGEGRRGSGDAIAVRRGTKEENRGLQVLKTRPPHGPGPFTHASLLPQISLVFYIVQKNTI